MSEKYKNINVGKDLISEWVKGTSQNLMLDKPIKALPSTHKRVKGKDVPVNKQISDYLKSLGMLEKSVKELEDTIEKSDKKLKEIKLISESKVIKKKYKGRIYSSTTDMINAVRLEAAGKISYNRLLEIASWSRDPKGIIEVSRMIAGIGRFTGL